MSLCDHGISVRKQHVKHNVLHSHTFKDLFPFIHNQGFHVCALFELRKFYSESLLERLNLKNYDLFKINQSTLYKKHYWRMSSCAFWKSSRIQDLKPSGIWCSHLWRLRPCITKLVVFFYFLSLVLFLCITLFLHLNSNLIE